MNLLIVSYYFPPYNKVGARRWAKHCKYFYKEGIDFHVVAGSFSGTSPWDKDIRTFENRISRVPLKAIKKPYYMQTLPGSMLQKVRWKASLWLWRFRKNFVTGNYQDVSSANVDAFYQAARQQILTHKHDILLISVGPFSYSQILPPLKKEFPALKIVIDYRDYWEDEFDGLNARQVETESRKQSEVLSAIDLVLSPNEEMQRYYAEQMQVNSYCLPHCYDEDDIQAGENVQERRNSELSLIYGGAFYSGIEESIQHIRQLIDQLSETKQVKAEFYVSIKGFEEELSHPAITRHGFMDSHDYFEKVKQADYAILILPPNRVNAMSSKFYELLALRKPILYFGGKGAVSEFLMEHQLGFHITAQNIREQAKLVLSNVQTKTIPGPYRIEDHTFAFHTKALCAQLEQLHQS